MVCFEPIVLLRIVPIVLLRFGKYILKHNVEAHIVNFFHKIFVQQLILRYVIFTNLNHQEIDWFKYCSHHSASICLWSEINPLLITWSFKSSQWLTLNINDSTRNLIVLYWRMAKRYLLVVVESSFW